MRIWKLRIQNKPELQDRTPGLTGTRSDLGGVEAPGIVLDDDLREQKPEQQAALAAVAGSLYLHSISMQKLVQRPTVHHHESRLEDGKNVTQPSGTGVRMSPTATDILHKLSARPMDSVQIGTVTICLLINLIDGFDVLAMAFAASSIGQEWQLSPTEFGVLFSSGLAGMTISSMRLAPVADYSGRRTAIVMFLVVISIAMAASALADSVVELATWRFVTGLGVGGLLPAINTMVAELASRRRQELAVSIMQAGFPLGASIGGIAACFLIEAHGWQSVFWVGAGLSSAMIVLVWLKLPEFI